MSGLLVWLVPVALGMGLAGLCAFLWSMQNGQLEDLDGAGQRILHQPADEPLAARAVEAPAMAKGKGGRLQ